MKPRVGAPRIAISGRRIIEKNIDETEGIIKGILADGKIVQKEAEFLLKWLDAHKYLTDKYPYSLIYQRLLRALEDDFLDKEEAGELREIMLQFMGGLETQDVYVPLSTTIPLDNPPPEVIFDNRLFCFTGTFLIGKRREVEEMTRKLNGRVHKDVVMKLDYLVVGTMATSDWKHAHYGRKIERAVMYRERGCGVKIIHEDWWLRSFPGF